jgi:elongation factor 1 alpha-like protein
LQGQNNGLISNFSSAGKKSTPTTQKSTTKKSQNAGTTPKDDRKPEDISSSVSSLKISDAPAPKSKGLDVVKEFEQSGAKRSASFVVVGKCALYLVTHR